MANRSELQHRIETRNGATVVTLTGNVTEHADLGPLRGLRGQVVLDLAGIKRINSLGVRTWYLFVKECEAAGMALEMIRVAPVMVAQMAMITHFMGERARVSSIYVPYVCPSCNKDTVDLVEIPPGGGPAVKPSVPCPACKTAMELDEPVELYTELFPAT